ncbi:MAG TPA: sigma-70 family RNA polymerase sigma factor [Acidobacteriota bacterium]
MESIQTFRGLRTLVHIDEKSLIETYRPRVLYFLLRRLRDRSLAEELTQETLIIAMQAVRQDRLREEAKLAGYVFGIAKNLYYKTCRQRAQQDKFTADSGGEPCRWLIDPEAAVLLEEQRKQVRCALDAMRADDREILRRALVDAQPLEEIAHELGVPYAAVRKRKSRAIERLRKVFLAMSQTTL